MAELHEQTNRLWEENERLRTRLEAGRAEQSLEPPRPFPSSRPGKGKEVTAPEDIDLPADDEQSSCSSYSRAVHHPRTPRKPNLEKGHLTDPADPSVLQGVGCRENPTRTNDRQRQLTNMCLTGLGVSPYQYHLCTCLSGPPQHSKCFFPPPFEDHRTCSPLPLDSIYWTTILPATFPYHPSPCTTVLLIRTITCYITTRQ